MIKFDSKKIKAAALMAFAMMASAASAQTLKVTSHGEPVANGDVLEIGWNLEYDGSYLQDFGFEIFTYKWDPHLEVSSSTNETVSVTVTSVNNTEGFQICWPENCLPVSPNGSQTGKGAVGSTPQDLQIHKESTFMTADELPTAGGEIKVLIEGAKDVVEVTVKAVLTDSAVGENFAESNVAPEYYTIQGVRVAEPQKGQLVIERKGAKAIKRIF